MRYYIRLVYAVPLFIGLNVHGQVSITGNTNNPPDDASMLDVQATNKGMLVPRVALLSADDATPITPAPPTSLLIYNTATAGSAPNNVMPGYYYWGGSGWVRLMSGNTAPLTGTGVPNKVAFWTSATDLGNNTVFHWDNSGNGKLGIGTAAPTTDYLLTLNASGSTQVGGLRMMMTESAAATPGLFITADNKSARGLLYENTSNELDAVFWGTGSVLTSTNIVSGFTAYRNSSGLSYGLFGITGTNVSYSAANANVWAAFLKGRTVISSENSPSSPLGVDLEVRNTTTGSAAPATVSLRQSTSLPSSGNVMADLNFGDNRTTDPQARIRALRDAASGSATDLPAALSFWTTPDGTATLTERMRIASSGNVGIGTVSPQAQLHTTGTLRFANFTNGFLRVDGSGNVSVGTGSDLFTAGDGLSWAGTTLNSLWTATGNDIYNNNTGNVGIGLTGAAGARLQVRSDNGVNLTLERFSTTAGHTAGLFYKVHTVSNLSHYKGGIIFERKAANGLGDLHFALNNVSDNSNVTLADTRMTITREGNVGIGNTAPNVKLNVGEAIPGGHQYVYLRGYGNEPGSWKGGAAFGYTTASVIMGELGGVATIGGHSGNLNAWSDLAINSGGGNVGIGTISSVERLNVGGNLFFTGARAELYANDRNHMIILRGRQDGSAVNETSYYQFGDHVFYTGGAVASQPERLRINSAGTVRVSSLAGAGTRFVVADASGNLTATQSTASGIVTGAGTTNYLARWTPDGSTLGIGATWDNGTNVGIGSTNPQQKLEIGANGGLGFSGGSPFLNPNDKKLYSPADGDLEWMTHDAAGVHGFAVSHQGTKRVYLNTSGDSYFMGGRVGIGIASPNSQLTVRTSNVTANARTASLANAIGDVSFELAVSRGAATNDPGDITTQIGQAYGGGDITEGIRFIRGIAALDGAMAFVTNNATERVRINSSGNVGIGTAGPEARLHVLGNAGGMNLEGTDHVYIQWFPDGHAAGRKAYTGFPGAASDDLTFANEITGGKIDLLTSNGNVRANSLGGTGTRFVVADTDGNITATQSTASGIVTGAGTTNYLARWTDPNTLGIGTTWDNGVDVGIGTTSPSAHTRLTVNNNTGASGARVQVLGTDATNSTWRLATPSSGVVAFGGNTDHNVDFGYFNNENTTFTPRVRVQANTGNVGIGATSPNAALEVFRNDGKIRISDTRADGGSGGSELGLEFTHHNTSITKTAIVTKGLFSWKRADMHFILNNEANNNSYTVGTDTRMIIKSDGNVGIGTTAPVGKLHVGGSHANGVLADGNDRPSIAATGTYPQMVMMSGNSVNVNHGATLMIGGYDSGASGAHKHWSIGTSGQNSTFLDIGYHAGTDLNPHAGIRNYNGSTFMTILNNGHVGIGTTAPVDRLDVRSAMSVNEIKFRNLDGGDDSDPYRLRKHQYSANNNELQLHLNDDADERFAIYGNSCSGFGCGEYSGNLYHWFRADGNAFHAGSLGIGTQTPSHKFHLVDGQGFVQRARGNGDWNHADWILERTGTLGVFPSISFHNPGQTAPQWFGSYGPERLNAGSCCGGGWTTVAASGFTTISDLSMKKEVETLSAGDLESVLADLRGINSIRYRYNNEISEEPEPYSGTLKRTQPHIGFSAQSLPREVVVDDLTKSAASHDQGYILGYSLNDMDGLLVAATKALDMKQRDTEETVKQLRNEILELKQLILQMMDKQSGNADR